MSAISSMPTWTGKQADFSELIKLKLLGSNDLSKLGFTIKEDVQSNRVEYKAPYLDKITSVRSGCTTASVGAGGLAVAALTLTVADFKVNDGQCASTFDTTIAELVRKKGFDINNLEGTDIDKLIQEIVLDGAARDSYRKLWLNDTTYGNADYLGYDGVFKKVKAGYLAADGTTNAGSITSTDLEVANIIATFNRVEDAQADELKYMPDTMKKMYVTDPVWKAYRRYLQSTQFSGVAESRMALINGIETLYYNNIELINLGIISKYLSNDFTGGSPATLTTGNRILLTVPDNHIVSTDALTDSFSLDFWYEKKDDTNYWRMFYKMGYTYAWGVLNTMAGW
jgi:hypothetical protein